MRRINSTAVRHTLDRVGSLRHAYQVVDELQTALANASVPGPYIYVGHGIGAVHARIYAHRDPNVLGMVLIEPVVETLGLHRAFLSYRHQLEQKYLGMLRQKRVGLLRPVTAWFSHPVLSRKLPSVAARELRDGYTLSVVQTILEELSALEEGIHQLHGLGRIHIPVSVLSASQDWLFQKDNRSETPIQAMHRKLALMAPGGIHEVVPRTSHHLHIEKLQWVVDAVENMITQLE